MNTCYYIVIGLTKNVTKTRNSTIPPGRINKWRAIRSTKLASVQPSQRDYVFLKLATDTIQVRKAKPC